MTIPERFTDDPGWVIVSEGPPPDAIALFIDGDELEDDDPDFDPYED